jgi:hypothetical protein
VSVPLKYYIYYFGKPKVITSPIRREYINATTAKMPFKLLKVASIKSLKIIDCKVYKIVTKAAPKVIVNYFGITVFV